MTKITIGARGSKLSLAYVEKVRKLLLKDNKELKEENINFKAIKTSGDINQNIKLSEIGGKNLFCKEIEEKFPDLVNAPLILLSGIEYFLYISGKISFENGSMVVTKIRYL